MSSSTPSSPTMEAVSSLRDPSSQPTRPTSSPPPPADPKVAELHLMFPTVEPSVIHLVLESSHGSSDRAIEQLLQMTDPEFRPDELQAVRHEEESQLDLDAQFARSLQMQDEQDYVPRPAVPPPQGGGENPPGMLALEDRLEKYAEVGKQTFNSLFGKAKAKYAELQATQAAEREGKSRPRESTWGENGSGYGGVRGGQRQDQAWRQPPPAMNDRGVEPNQRGKLQGNGLWGDSASSSSRSESFSSESTVDPIPQLSPAPPQAVPLRQSPARWQPSDAFDDPIPPARTLSASSPSMRVDVGGRRTPAVGSPGSAAGSPEKSTGKIDPAKLGILPKKRVDLLSTSPPPSNPTNNRIPEPNGDDDDNDPNPALPSATKSLVSQIPKTPPATSPYTLEDSDDELEYTKSVEDLSVAMMSDTDEAQESIYREMNAFA
ncbi:MAG: hypothetical protein TREMPRED_001335 [Tremellales sp. Tagirdzhanova-0007]|nr:MAG: hypothetical protein TREMPRED_001335 [Tremellales sp. Tagirdzhanova-0007]